MGGSCVNFGCTPTKAAIASARLAHQARRAAEYGLTLSDVSVDFEAVLARARAFALKGRQSLGNVFEGSGTPRLMRGHARLLGREGDGFRLAVVDSELTAREIVIDTGTTSVIPPIDGLDDVSAITAENWLHHTQLPSHLAIVGGGYIGLEMAQFYRRMGSAVTVIEEGARLAGREDDDIASCLRSLLEEEGVTCRLNERVEKIAARDGGLLLGLQANNATALEASDVFVAVGRQPNTGDLGLDTVGIETDKKGFIKVNECLATSCPGVWAAGDVRGGAMFTHTSWDDFRILKSQMVGNGRRTMARRVVPYAIFVDPQLGRVGMTEQEARADGREVKVARLDMSANGKAREIGEAAGLIKVVVDAADGTILGAAVLAHEGAEIVHCYVDVIQAGGTYRDIRDALHIHPTIAEAVQTVLAQLDS